MAVDGVAVRALFSKALDGLYQADDLGVVLGVITTEHPPACAPCEVFGVGFGVVVVIVVKNVVLLASIVFIAESGACPARKDEGKATEGFWEVGVKKRVALWVLGRGWLRKGRERDGGVAGRRRGRRDHTGGCQTRKVRF